MSPVDRLSQRDLGLAAAIGVLLAISPLSSPNVTLSILTGGGAAALFLAYRMYVAPASVLQTAGAGADSAPTVSDEPVVPLTVALCLIVFVAALYPTLEWLYVSWTESIWINTHGLFIPPIMGFLGYEILRRDRSTEPESSPWGFAFLLPGLAIVAMDSTMQTRYFSVVGLVLCLPGLSLLFLGARRTRMLAFPLFLGLFMIPVPGTFDSTLALREITARGAEFLLQLQGLTVIRSDTILEMTWGHVVVAKACSGLSTLYSSITVASILIYYSQTRQRKILIALLTVPLALVANIIRTLVLVMMSNQWGVQILDTQLHEASGVATFAVVLVILYMVSDMPKRRRRTA